MESPTTPRFVLPGTAIGVEEEYMPGPGTYVEDAKIYASVAGQVKEADRTLSIVRKNQLAIMTPGTVLVGRIEMISEPVALVLVEPTPTDAARFGSSSAFCVLHASYIKRGFVKNVRDELKAGDIIRAKVVEYKNGEYKISTDDEDCGCLKAFCTKCRHGLEKKPTGLQCPNCDNRENRRMAPDYGAGI